MDLWVVAAAAGAGYLAKYWKNVLGEREGSSEFSSRNSLHDNRESPSIIRDITRETSKQCMSDYSHEGGNMPSSSSFSPECKTYDNYGEFRGGGVVDSNVGDMSECNTSKMWASHSHGRIRRKKSLRNIPLHLQHIKPHGSSDSFVMAQMHKERAEMEEYLRSPLVSPCTPTLRPFFVTDGKQVISRVSGEFSDGIHFEGPRKTNDGAVGVPSLVQYKKANHSKEGMDNGKDQMGRSSKTLHFDSQCGSLSGQVLFCLGISIGIISSIVANRLEVERLKVSLNQTENLVQDLQEELEMKDSLTVTELVCDDDSQDTLENACGNKKLNMLSEQAKANVVVKYADKDAVALKEPESISKIEAELEAELELLELSMKGSTVQGGLLDGIEFDQEDDNDIVAELVHGELKADIIPQKFSSEPTSDQVSSSSSTTPLSIKEGVSPRELSLRLHEVIQSNLQQRIIELEAELAIARKRVWDLESDRKILWREMSNSESSSTLGSPNARSSMDRPLVMTLSGDALDAYNDAFEELDKLKGSQNETTQVPRESPQNNELLGNRDMYDLQIGVVDDVKKCRVTNVEPWPNGGKKIPFDEGSPKNFEDDDDDDQLLIKQIVEKARQGSPAILNAQKAMVFLERDEH